MKRLLFLMAVGFIWVIIFNNTSAAAMKDPINIGCTTDFSGITAQYGIQQAPIFEMIVKEVNAAGGINGRQINFFSVDNAGDPSKLVGNLKMFKELHKCVAIIQGISSSCGIAAKAWAEQNRIPIIAPYAASDRLWQKGGKVWYFRVGEPTAIRVKLALQRIKKLGYTKLGFHGTTLTWGADALASLKEQAPEYGIKIVGEVFCEPKSKDLTIQAIRLRDTGAEAVFSIDYEAETGVWGRALKSIGWKPYSWHQSGPTFAITLLNYPSDIFEGWETNQIIDYTNPAVKKIWDKYKEYTGKRYDDEKGPVAWDTIRLLLEAIRVSGNPDNPEAIRDGFYKIKNFQLACGLPGTVANFESSNWPFPEKALVLYVVKSGRLEVIKEP